MATPAPQQPLAVPTQAAAPPKVYSAERQPGLEHIPIYPRNFIILRIVQLFLAVVVLGLCAFTIHYVPTNGSCLSIFVAIATLITMVWLLVANFAHPKLYNYWAVLALDIFLVIFWLIGMAVTASEANILFSVVNNAGYYDLYGYNRGVSTLEMTWLSCLAATAGVGGLLFALFITSLVLHSIALHRHRAAGLHCNPGVAPNPVVPGGGPAPNASAAEKTTAYATTNPAYQAAPGVQQPYAAPGYPQQQTQQYYNPAAAQQTQQGYYAPQPQYPQAQAQPQAQYPYQYQTQPQQVYPPQQPASPAPLSAQLTGNSTQVSTHNAAPASAPLPNNVQEAPAQNYHQQQ